MADYLTGALATFNIEASKSAIIIDKINEVDNNFAVTSVGLAQAINKAGASAEEFGVTLNELLGYTTAINMSTRESGKQIGNMLKSSFAKINSDVAVDALNSIGVATKDVTGELRPLGQIYEDIATKWDTLSRAQKTFVAESISSKYHITRMLALFDNWKIAQDAMATSETSLGSAIEENYKHLNSLESQLNKLSAASTEFAYTMGESGVKGAMSGVIGVMTTLINGVVEFSKVNLFTDSNNPEEVEKYAKANMLLKTSIAAATVALVAFGVTFNSVSVGSKVRLITTLGITWDVLTAKILASTAAAGAFATALALNPLVWIGGAIIGLTYFIGKQKQMREEQEQLNKSFEETKEKLDAIIDRSTKIGSPVPEDVSDLEALIKNLDAYKDKIDEINENHKLQDPQGSEKVSDISRELKDRATQLGINITQYKNLDEVLVAITQKYNELSTALKNAKENSIEYQGRIIETARNNQQEAQSIVDLVNEYERLNSVTNKSEAQAKRYAEVLDILRAIFPQLAQGNSLNIGLMKEEANARLRLTTETQKNAEVTIRANLAKLQSDAETAIKAIAFIDAEIAKLHELSVARQSLSVGDFKFLEYADSTKANYNKMYTDATDASKKIRDILFGSSAPIKVGGGTSKVGSSSKSSQMKVDKYETDQYTQALSDLDRQLAQSAGRQEKLTETSEEYRKETELQISLTKQKQELMHQEADRLRALNTSLESQLSSLGDFNKLSEEQKKVYNDLAKEIDNNKIKINSLSSSWWDLEKSIEAVNEKLKEAKEKLADEIVELYKDMYERQKEIALQEIDEEMEALERSHERKMERLDEELEKYEEIIQAKLDLIDTQEDEDDFNKNLTNLEKEKQEILNKINILSLDDSFEARAKLADLNEELAGKETDIEELKHDRIIDLRKENLENQLEIYKTDIEAKKELENEKYEREKRRLDRIKKRTERHFDELINDERKFAKTREKIMDGHMEEIIEDLDDFKDFMDEHMKDIGDSITENVLDKIASLKDQLEDLNDMDVGGGGSGSGVPDEPGEGGIIPPGEFNDYTSGGSSSGSSGGSSGGGWEDMNQSDIDRILKNSTFHEGGTVGDKPPSRIVDIVNKLFNTKPNEQMVKALVGELYIPQKNILSNFIPNMQSLLSSFSPAQPVTATSNNINLSVYVDKMVADDKKQVDTVFNTILNKLNKSGKLK